MRGIKFRAWSSNQNNMLDWDYLRTLQAATLFEVGATEIPVMQYTGLKDKNGTEIYEGDIVKDKWVTKVVSYCEEGFTPFKYDGGGEMMWWECEVIGNIYENAELLDAV